MPPELYETSFGSVRLYVSRLSTPIGRSIVVHDPSTGDEHTIQDRGRVLATASVTLLFDWMTFDDLSPLDRLKALRNEIDDRPRIFRHPIEGSYLARIGAFDVEIDEHGVISATCEIYPAGDILTTDPAKAGMITASGVGAVSAAAMLTQAEYDALGLGGGDLPARCASTVDAWAASPDTSPRNVLVQTGALADELGTMSGSLDNSLDTWAAFKATIMLAEAVRAAADLAMSDAAATFVMRIGSAVALRSLLASLYGADDAQARYDAVLLLNDIATPALLPPGTVLSLPQLPAAARNG